MAMRSMDGRIYTTDQPEEKNSKQVLIDWVMGVRSAADTANTVLHSDRKDAMNVASDYIGMIRGMCVSMMAVLENSD